LERSQAQAREIREAIERGEKLPGPGTPALIRVLALIGAAVWAWKAVETGQDGQSVAPALVWACAFVLSAVMPSKVRLWPLVLLVWCGYLAHHFATAENMSAQARMTLGGLFGGLTLLVLYYWVTTA